MLPTLTLVKIGGDILADDALLDQFLTAFVHQTGPKLLVHGGGQRAAALCEQLGIPVRTTGGRRITDAATLEVVTMVYAGLVNTQLTARLNARGCRALGLSGADLDLIRARKRTVGAVDFGFVGDVAQIDTTALRALLDQQVVPAFCALTHDGAGQLLNTNADTIATELALALAAHYRVSLHYCGRVPGVLTDAADHRTVLPVLRRARYAELLREARIHSGMLPKLENAFRAAEAGIRQVSIGGPDHWPTTSGTLLQPSA